MNTPFHCLPWADRMMSWPFTTLYYCFAINNFFIIAVIHHHILGQSHPPFLHLLQPMLIASPSPTDRYFLFIVRPQTHDFTVEFIAVDARSA